MRDIKTGQLLRDPKGIKAQKTLFNYAERPYEYHYGVVNLDHPYGKYRWKEIGYACTERTLLRDMRESLSWYYPACGYALRESPEDMSVKTAKTMSIGIMIRMKGAYLDERVIRRYFHGRAPSFCYIFFKRMRYAWKESIPCIVHKDGTTEVCMEIDLDPYSL